MIYTGRRKKSTTAQAQNTQRKKNPQKAIIRTLLTTLETFAQLQTRTPHDNRKPKPKPTRHSKSQLIGCPKTMHN